LTTPSLTDNAIVENTAATTSSSSSTTTAAATTTTSSTTPSTLWAQPTTFKVTKSFALDGGMGFSDYLAS